LRRAPAGPSARRTMDRALPLFDDAGVAGALKDALPLRFRLETVPDDTLDQVRSKERDLEALTRRDGALAKWKRVADLWCASWFAPRLERVPASAFTALSDRILTRRRPLAPLTAEACLARASVIAAEGRFFPWELEFPEVFFGADGTRLAAPGFDAVVGNPPWDMIRADGGPEPLRAASRDEIGRLLRFTRDS